MIDLKLLRENPEQVRTAINRKKFSCDLDAILELEQKRRAIIGRAEQARAEQKAANKEMAQLPKGSEAFLAKVKQMKGLAATVKELQAEQQAVEADWEAAFLTIPNLPDKSVPDGEREEDNKELSSWGDRDSNPHAVPHYELEIFKKGVPIERGNKVTGAGFPFLVGDMARLMRALIEFCLREAIEQGYIEIMPPLLVNAASATATGQLPDKEGQMYRCADDPFFFIPTAEVPVTNLYREEILNASDLPVYHVAYTPCFRREAGSYGQHVRGFNRLHQFDKVELVKWVHPDQSFQELESLRESVEALLQKLELPYRLLAICAGDIGFPHSKQYDLEVWAQGQKRWLEVSSCSNFTDFQARRANIRFRDKEGKLQTVHTLNGSHLGLARTFAAILENNAQADGSVLVPKVLQDWMGKTVIQIR